MFLMDPATASVFGLFSLLGGVANSGASYLSNKKLQEDAQAHQLYMSNTAYQRGVADMKAAGLNPNLLLNNGGAAVSGYSSANSSAAADFTSAITNLVVNSALSKQNYEQQVKLSTQNYEQQLKLQNDKQAFLRTMSESKVNSAKTNDKTFSKDIKNNSILNKMQKL